MSFPEVEVPLYTIRCTQILLKKLRLAPAALAAIPESDTILGDWYANRLNFGPHRLVLCVSERSLLCAVVPARELVSFPDRLRESVRGLLQYLRIPAERIDAELAAMQGHVFAKTASRTVLGSMNDFAVAASWGLQGYPGPEALRALERDLVETPCGPLKYKCPAEKTRELFGVTGNWYRIRYPQSDLASNGRGHAPAET